MINSIINFRKLCLYALFAILFCSCKSYDDVRYLKNIQEVDLNANNQHINYDNKIVPNDLLRITVTADDPKSVAPFNLPLVSFINPEQNEVGYSNTLQSYLVNNEGYIYFPIFGEIKVGGLTREECTKMLEKKISEYAKNPIVTVNISNFRYTVLGEVNSPGVKSVTNDRTSIIEAIGKAGDLNLYAKRDNIMLIREENGERKVYTIDLGDASLLNSEAYYIRQNDIIYVQPNKYKEKNARYSQRDAYEISVFSAIVSTVSVIASLIIALLVK